MSVAVSERVWRYSKSTGSARLVLLSIADHCSNEDGTGSYPSYSRLTLRTGLSRQTVADAIKTLKKLGELEVAKSRKRDERKSNTYRVTITEPVNDDPEFAQSETLTSQGIGLGPIGLAVVKDSDQHQSENLTTSVYTGRREPYLSVRQSFLEASTSEDAPTPQAGRGLSVRNEEENGATHFEKGRRARVRTPEQEAEHAAALARVRGL